MRCGGKGEEVELGRCEAREEVRDGGEEVNYGDVEQGRRWGWVQM